MEYNAGERKDVRRAEKQAKVNAQQDRETIGHILSTKPSRAWLYRLLASCNVFHTTYSRDTHDTAFSEGRRSIGLALLADTMAFPDFYMLMVREANEREFSRSLPNTRRADSNGDTRNSGFDDADADSFRNEDDGDEVGDDQVAAVR